MSVSKDQVIEWLCEGNSKEDLAIMFLETVCGTDIDSIEGTEPYEELVKEIEQSNAEEKGIA